MSRDESVLGTLAVRDESPEAELRTQEAIGNALSLLLTQKGLYQNVRVDL